MNITSSYRNNITSQSTSDHGPTTRRPLSTLAWRLAFPAKSSDPKAPGWMTGKPKGNSVFRKEIDMNWYFQGYSNHKMWFLKCHGSGKPSQGMVLGWLFWNFEDEGMLQHPRWFPRHHPFLLTNTNGSQNNTEWQRQWVKIKIYYNKTKHQHSLRPSTGIAQHQTTWVFFISLCSNALGPFNPLCTVYCILMLAKTFFKYLSLRNPGQASLNTYWSWSTWWLSKAPTVA